MISHARRASAGMTCVNVKTIEFSMIEQSVVNGETPATLFGRPSCVGEPPNTASMWLTLPGSVSVMVTSNGPKISFMHAVVAAFTVAEAVQPGIAVRCCAIVDLFVREALVPGDSVT